MGRRTCDDSNPNVPVFSLSTPMAPTGMTTIFANTQDPIIAPEPAYPVGHGNGPATYISICKNRVDVWLGGGSGASATATLSASVGSLARISRSRCYTSAPTVTITGTTGSGATVLVNASTPLLPKTIQELFTLDYGRMNATLSVELPFTNFLTQTTVPYGFVDPPTELVQDGETQIWKITHNGVDTHFIHFHQFAV